MQLTEKDVAVVTGAASGIGLALVRAFTARGMATVMSDVRADRLEAAAEAVRADGGTVTGVVADVSRAEEVERLADRALAKYGRVDVLCNNAGVSPRPGAAWEIAEDTWRWSIDVGLMGVVHGIRCFLPAMVARGRGHVLNTASAGGLTSVPGRAPYAAVKHAVVGLTETIREELAEVAPGVGMSVLCPGPVATELSRSSRETAPGGLARSPDQPRGVAPTTPRSGAILAAGTVAALALEGIEAGRLHIVTNTDTSPLIRARLASVEADLPV